MKKIPPTVTIEAPDFRCAGCDVIGRAIVREARAASDCGRSDGNPDRLIAVRWSSPEGWGRFSFEDGRGNNARGDLCPECVPKVRAELRHAAGYAVGKEPPP